MVTFLLGVLVGGVLAVLGVLLFACCCASKDAEEEAERERRAWHSNQT